MSVSKKLTGLFKDDKYYWNESERKISEKLEQKIKDKLQPEDSMYQEQTRNQYDSSDPNLPPPYYLGGCF